MLFWKRIIRNYFTFNNRERRGIYVLISILFGLVAVHIGLRFYPTEPLQLSITQLSIVDSIQEKKANDLVNLKEHQFDNSEVHWKKFDPNTVLSKELASLGLDEHIANRIVKYREKGGKFYEPEDLLKIYGIDERWFTAAQSYVVINQENDEIDESSRAPRWINVDSSKKKSEFKLSKFELNSVDSATLDSLPWVGGFTAGEIISLRNRLQGFRSYEQLLEIYRISDKAIENIVKYSTLDTNLAVPIDLNRCNFKTLGQHPYLTWKQAKILINYRDQHGPYTSVRGILKTSVINDSVYAKIAPYLTVSK